MRWLKRRSSGGRLGPKRWETLQNAVSEQLATVPSTADVEAEARPLHCLSNDPVHTMQSFFGRTVQNVEGAEFQKGGEGDRFLSFYNEKVKKAQELAGNTDHAPISGNLYMYRALAAFGDSSGLNQEKATPLVLMSLWIIIIVQTAGPMCILFWAIHKVDVKMNGNMVSFGTETFQYRYGSSNYGVSHITQHILGLLFLILFMMNGLYALRSDKDETRKLIHLCKIFSRAAKENKGYQQPSETWLWVGSIINSLCLVTCCLCMFFLFIIAADGPKDVLFDAFSLTFLYNLDDIGGDLGFLDEKWDADLMGDLHGALAKQRSIMQQIDEERQGTFTPDNIYDFFECILYVMLVALPILFSGLDITRKDSGNDRRLSSELEAHVMERVLSQLAGT